MSGSDSDDVTASPAAASRSREGPQPGYGESENTDTHLWPIVSETPYAPSLRITAEGALSINVGSLVIVKPIEEWHALALADLDARTAELRSRLQPAAAAEAPGAERVNKTLADANDLLASISAALAEQEEENERLREALKPVDDLPRECVAALIHQRQIDKDGTEVGVSRQAVDEIHAALVLARSRTPANREGG